MKARGTKARAPSRILVTVIVSALALGACHNKPRGGTDLGSATDTGASEDGFVAPPQVIRADVGGAGSVVLHGSAAPGALIRLQAPEGDSRTATARSNGSWSLRLPPVARPRMFALSASSDGRSVHAEGALIMLPRPGPPALLARAGFGALVVERAGARPTLATIDYDPGGFAAFSGAAAPHATVRLTLDGAPAGVTQADAMGRYAVLAANHRLSFDTHFAVIQVGAEESRQRFQLTPPGPLSSPYQATEEPGAWRIEWAAPGGGVQTTLVLAPP